MVQGDLRAAGKGAASIKVSVGDAEQMSVREARATAMAYLSEISRGRHPKAKLDEPRNPGREFWLCYAAQAAGGSFAQPATGGF
jgi:hypothetical protein